MNLVKAPAVQLHLPLEIRPEPTLESYFAGPNLEALAAVTALAGGQGEPYLLLVGASGTGKSHLLQAACQAAVQTQRQAHFVPLGLKGLEPALLEGLEWFDLVAVDDLHDIAGDLVWERALFHLFNRLREQGGALLCAARAAPDALPFALPDLASRLAWGPRYRLLPLSDADCEQLLIESAQRRGLQLTVELVQFIMHHYARDPASLLDLLARLDSLSLREQRPPSIQLLRRLMLGQP